MFTRQYQFYFGAQLLTSGLLSLFLSFVYILTPFFPHRRTSIILPLS
jgi:hypothetical protein